MIKQTLSQMPGWARHTLVVGLVSMSLVFMAGCGDDEIDDTPVEVKKDPTEKPAPAPEPVATDQAKADEMAYTYDAVNRRDPFKTYFDELVLVEADSATLTELQRIELDKLTLVGVVTGTATPMALVQDASKRGHTVKIGTLIGKRFGQVKQIRRGEIIVQEEFRDFTGKRIPVYKPLKLPEKDKVTP